MTTTTLVGLHCGKMHWELLALRRAMASEFVYILIYILITADYVLYDDCRAISVKISYFGHVCLDACRVC